MIIIAAIANGGSGESDEVKKVASNNNTKTETKKADSNDSTKAEAKKDSAPKNAEEKQFLMLVKLLNTKISGLL